jgi:hypothetical protein
LIAGGRGSSSLKLDGHHLVFSIVRRGGRSRVRARAGLLVRGKAHHVVGTFDGGTQRLFVDGVEVAKAAGSGSIAHRANQFDIGSARGSDGAFRGLIDEVAVYARALGAARVKAHYRAGTWPQPRS